MRDAGWLLLTALVFSERRPFGKAEGWQQTVDFPEGPVSQGFTGFFSERYRNSGTIFRTGEKNIRDHLD